MSSCSEKRRFTSTCRRVGAADKQNIHHLSEQRNNYIIGASVEINAPAAKVSPSRGSLVSKFLKD